MSSKQKESRGAFTVINDGMVCSLDQNIIGEEAAAGRLWAVETRNGIVWQRNSSVITLMTIHCGLAQAQEDACVELN